ncbi:MAG: hypothetical protein P8010_26990 [Desulfosarcinaceae bacterium]
MARDGDHQTDYPLGDHHRRGLDHPVDGALVDDDGLEPGRGVAANHFGGNGVANAPCPEAQEAAQALVGLAGLFVAVKVGPGLTQLAAQLLRLLGHPHQVEVVAPYAGYKPGSRGKGLLKRGEEADGDAAGRVF